MVERKSLDEYKAVAMLMGLHYDRGTHTLHTSIAIAEGKHSEYDADTLHQLTTEQVGRRMIEGYQEGTLSVKHPYEWIEKARKLEAEERIADAEKRNEKVPHNGEDAAV